MKVEDIKTLRDAQRYCEGCVNDFDLGVSTKEELMHNLGEYTAYLMGFFYERTIEKIKENPNLLQNELNL